MIALLVGFNYRNSNHSIPGIIVDLYEMKKLSDSLNLDTYIITDISKDEDILNLADYVLKEGNFNVLNFMKENKEKDRWIVSKDLSNLSNDIPKSDKILLYFSGHGIKGKIQLSNGDEMKNIDFLSLFCSFLNEQGELLWINDSCEFTSDLLSYKLGNNSWEVSDLNTSINRKVQIISSSNYNTKSETSIVGSDFTKYIIEKIKMKNRLIEIKNGNKNAYVHSTFQNYDLFDWITPKKFSSWIFGLIQVK